MATSTSFLVSDSVIAKIKALPADIRSKLTSALAGELILGEDPREHLSPVDMMVYTFIKFDITRDTQRMK